MDLDHLTFEDGVMDEVLEVRDDTGADLVCLVRGDVSGSTSGLAWLLNRTDGNPDRGFSVVEADRRGGDPAYAKKLKIF